MAQTNYTPISLYYSTTASAVPTAANLVPGELAINTNDGKLYYEDSSGVVQVLATKSTGSIGGSNTQVQFNNSGSLGGSSSFTWDGTTVTATKFAGALNGTVGATTASTGAFTSITASTTLGITGVATFSAGTVSLPAITTTGDTNTGIYFPAADTIAFTEGGVESMRIDSSGNVGIGTSSPTKKISIGTTAASPSNGYNILYEGTEVASFTSNAGTGEVRIGATNGVGTFFPTFYSNNTERMRIDSSGNVGIGTTSSGAKLDAAGTIRSTGNTNPSSGSGAELVFDGTNGTFLAYNRGGSAWLPAQVLGSTAKLIAQTSDVTVSTVASANAIFITNNTERMRIDSSGNVGIGTSSPSVKLHVSTSGAGIQEVEWLNNSQAVGADVGSAMVFTGTSSNNGLARISGAFAGATTADGAYMAFSTRAVTTGTLAEKMRLDTSGNLGLGVTPSASSLSGNLQLKGGGLLYSYANTDTTIGNNVYYNSGQKYIASSQASFYQQYQGAHYWSIAPSGTAGNTITFTQAMTLDASGQLLLGKTSTAGTAGGGVLYLGKVDAARDDGDVAVFKHTTAGNTVGSISISSTLTTYNVTSDYRLKTVTGSVTGQGERIDALKPIDYQWKEGNQQARGFLAHEFQTVYPNSVSGEKDAIDADGKPVYQTMQASTAEVIADLVAEIQSLRQRITNLENK